MDDESLANLMAGVLRKDPALMKKTMQSDDVDWNQLGGQQHVEQTINKYAHHLLKLKDDAAKFNQDLHHNRRDGQATAADKGPATVASLQQEGKDKFVAKQFIEALFCYDAALLLMQDNKQQQQQQQQQEAPSDQGQLLLSVLLNLSATHMKLQQPQHALVYAAAAVAFSCERSSKAYYRLAIALDQLHGTAAAAAAAGSNRASSLASAAVIMMKKAQRLLPPTATAQAKAEMMSQLQSEGAKKSAASSSSSSSNADEMNRALLVLVEHLANTIHHATAAAADTMHSQQADSSSSDGAGVSAATLKDRGNSAFKKGNYMQALQHYQACFHTLQSSSSSSTAAVLLSNKAACCLQLGDKEALLHGAVDAAAAIVLCNAQVKAYYRAANALLQLGLLPQAAAVCDLGMLQSPNDVALQQLKRRIATGDGSSRKPSSSSSSKPSSSRTGASSSSSSSDKKGLSERDFIALQRKDKASADVMSMLNSLSQMAAAAGKDVSQIFDTRIPPFHEEYLECKRCPSQTDSQAVYHKLWEGYEAARSQPSSMLGLQKHAAVFNIETMRLRLTGPNDKEGLEWLCTAPFGNVRFCERGAYRGGYQSFSNTTAKAEFLALDTTHVAIGFVDLGGLAASCKLLMEHHRLDAADREGWRLLTAAAGGPLRWVGYEMSAYAVAKSLVLLEMIEQNASVDSLLQAWYSSAWSNSTLEAFRSALTAVVNKQQQQQQRQPAAVLQILRHWQTHDVPLSKSRKLWLSSQALTLTFIANFKRTADRVALCEYITTGQLLPGGAAAADVGNVMMFEVPGGHTDRAYDESVLQTLHSIPLLKQVASGGSSGPDIMSVATNIIRDQLSSLKGLIRAGAVTAEVRHGSVTPSSNTIISAIKSLQPYTITWSNVPDYFTPAEFHKLARAVSADGNTVHYMHTMNWIRDVKGCSHVDFMLSMPEEILPKAMPQIRDASNQAASELYKSHDLGKLMLLPPVDTIRNIIDWSLCLKYCKDWVSAFFAPPLSGMKHVERQVQLVGPPEYSVLSRSNTTMFITFTYDEEINFTQMKRHEMVNM